MLKIIFQKYSRAGKAKLCLNVIKWEQIHKSSRNQWNKLLLKIKFQKYPKTDQAKICLNAIQWEQIHKYSRNQWNKLLRTKKSQKHSKSSQAKLSIIMQYNQNEYLTLARINEINYCFKSYCRSIPEQAKQSFLP